MYTILIFIAVCLIILQRLPAILHARTAYERIGAVAVCAASMVFVGFKTFSEKVLGGKYADYAQGIGLVIITVAACLIVVVGIRDAWRKVGFTGGMKRIAQATGKAFLYVLLPSAVITVLLVLLALVLQR